MKLRIAVAMAVIATLLSIWGCTATKASPAGEVSVGATFDDFMKNQHISKNVEVAANSTLTVTLFSNQTTGFQWSEKAKIGDNGLLEQIGHEFVAPESKGIVGAGGQEVWTFKALKKGETTVSMEYSRPWEGGEKGEWTFDLTVTVK